MEEISQEDLERIKNVFSKYKDGYESGIVIKSVLLTIGEQNKNDDIFEMLISQDVQVFYDDGPKNTKHIQGPPMKIGKAVLDSRRIFIDPENVGF